MRESSASVRRAEFVIILVSFLDAVECFSQAARFAAILRARGRLAKGDDTSKGDGDLQVDTLTHKQIVNDCMLTTNIEGAMSSDIGAWSNGNKGKVIKARRLRHKLRRRSILRSRP